MGEQQTAFGAQIMRVLDTNGDGTGSKNAAADHSGAEQAYYIKPGGGELFTMHRLLVAVRQGGVWTAASFGSGASLTNGIKCQLRRDGVNKLDLFDGESVKSNGSWGGLCYDVDLKSWGAGDSFLIVRWTFSKAGIPLVLDGRNGDEFAMLVNDNLSGLDEVHFFAQGYAPRGV